MDSIVERRLQMSFSNGSAAAAWTSCDARGASLSVTYLVLVLHPLALTFLLQLKKELWQILESSCVGRASLIINLLAGDLFNYRLRNMFLT